MYFKLRNNSTRYGGTANIDSTSWRRHMLADLYNVILGNITATSGLNSTVWNRSRCVITGSRPTSGIYTNGVSNTTTNASYNDYYFAIRKYHYGKTINSSFNAYRELSIRWHDNWGFSPRMATHSTSQNTSGNWAYGWSGNSNTTTAPEYQQLDSPYEVLEIEGIVNDKVLFIRVNRDDNVAGWKFNFAMIDQEYQANLDDHLSASYQYWCPTIEIVSIDHGLEANNTVGRTNTNADYKVWKMYKSQVVGQNTNGYNTSVDITGYQNTGYDHTDTVRGHYVSMYPFMWWEMPQQIPMPNGDNGYIMQPMLCRTGLGTKVFAGQHYDYKEYARMMNFYRTNDDSFYTGERVLDADGNAYRAFRLNKCGGANAYYAYNHSVYKNAVYLIPEGGT